MNFIRPNKFYEIFQISEHIKTYRTRIVQVHFFLEMKLFGLHGFLQNSKKFTIQCHALTRKLKRVGVEVIFLNGPYLIKNTNDSRSWCSDKTKDVIETEYQLTDEEKNNII